MLVLIRGLPGSGKSTLAKTLSNFHHYEADQYFLDPDGTYRYNVDFRKVAHECCQKKTRYALSMGYNAVVSNTFTQRWEMEPYYKIAAEFGVKPLEVTCHGKWPNVHGVPDDVLEKMAARWEA